jgi:hypothetical protein
MPLLLLLALVIAAVLLTFYKGNALSTPLFHDGETYILIDDGVLRVRKGFVSARVVTTLADLLRNAGVSQGYITLSRDRRVSVSWHVPPALHQTIRNVLLSEH